MTLNRIKLWTGQFLFHHGGSHYIETQFHDNELVKPENYSASYNQGCIFHTTFNHISVINNVYILKYFSEENWY